MIAGEASIEQVIERRRARVITRAGYRSLLVRLIFLAAVFYLLFTYAFLITQCQGQGMYPALKDGDLCVVFRKEARDLFGEQTVAEDAIAYRTGGRAGKSFFPRMPGVSCSTPTGFPKDASSCWGITEPTRRTAETWEP